MWYLRQMMEKHTQHQFREWLKPPRFSSSCLVCTVLSPRRVIDGLFSECFVTSQMRLQAWKIILMLGKLTF